MRRIGPYELQEEIARGGMGVVYRARGPEGDVALKVLTLKEDAARFDREIQLAVGLRHPGIVTTYGGGRDPAGRPFLVMERIQGESLDRRLRGGPLPVHEAVRIVLDLCQAVAYAHDQGVIHRDLKPANVLLASSGQIKLTDFGLGRALHSAERLTMTGEILGTPAFMAPEQAGGSKQVGPAADVYGLGSTLYALLTGRPPFGGATTINVFQAVIHDSPRAPSADRAGLDPDLDQVVLRCLAKEPAERYRSARELEQALLPWGPAARSPWAEDTPNRSVGSSRRVALAVLALGALGAAGILILERGPAPPGAEPSVSSPRETADPVAELRQQAWATLRRGDNEGAWQLITQAIDRSPDSAGLHHDRALLTLTGKGVSEALEDAEHAVRLAPESAAPLILRGSVNYLLREIQLARVDLEHAQTLLEPDSEYGSYVEALVRLLDDPTLPPPLPPSIQLLPLYYRDFSARFMDASDPPRALACLAPALERYPQDGTGWLTRAALRALIDQLDAAIEDANHAIELMPAAEHAVRARAQLYMMRANQRRSSDHEGGRTDLLAAIRDWSWVAQKNPQSGTPWAKQATLYDVLGDQAAALKAASLAIQLGTPHAVPFTLRGEGRLAKGDARGALEDFKAALELRDMPRARQGVVDAVQALTASPPGPAPQDEPSTWLARATQKANAYDFRGALAELDRDLPHESGNLEPLMIRARVRMLLGQFPGAREDLLACRDLASSNPNLSRGIAKALAEVEAHSEVHLQLENGDRALALRVLEQALAENPDSALLLRTRGTVRVILGQYELAREDLARSIELRPEDPRARFDMACLELAVQDDGATLEALNDAIRLDPEYPEAYLARSTILTVIGSTDDALLDLATYMALRPEDHDALILRGEVHLSLGRFAAGRADLERCRTMDLTPKQAQRVERALARIPPAERR